MYECVNFKKMAESDQDEEYCQNSNNQENQKQQQQQGQGQGQDEDDPLDAFMEGLEDKGEEGQKNNKPKDENEYSDESDGDLNSSIMQEEIMVGQLSQLSQEQKHQKTKKQIEPLKPFNFENYHFQDFKKDFYTQHKQIQQMTTQTQKSLIKQYEIKIQGTPSLKPIVSFRHLPLTERIFKIISSQNFQHPTPIQSIALPYALMGKDLIGVAKTGSGKTLAFVWPMIIHVNHRRPSNKGEGPTALILAPTRELCQQIYVQACRYVKKQSIKIDCLLGGENKHQQWKSLKAGVDIFIASPGRLIQMLKKKATNLLRVTYLVLDEVDKMLELGFEQQIRSIISQTRPDRQTLLFTATMKKNTQMLISDIVTDPVKIFVGDQTSANENIKQEVVIIKQEKQKFEWLQQKIKQLVALGKILVFANERMTCENLRQFLAGLTSAQVLTIHGDKNQYERTVTMNSFKKSGQILIATEIASRGIDVKNIKTVINFDCPKTIEAYIHRIGRAGRAGEVGTSYTFLLPSQSKFAIGLVTTFQNSGYPVPEELEEIAMLDDKYRRKRITTKMGISFAKGKDATIYLNNALKRQRKGYSRAGIGYDKNQTKDQKNTPILNKSQTKNATIYQISEMIKNKLHQREKQGKTCENFVKSQDDDLNKGVLEPTITYFNKK